jgi:thioesterase domain-containing protein
MVRRMMLVTLLALGLAGCASSASSSPSPSAPTATPTPSLAPSGPAGLDAGAVGRAFVDALARGDGAAAEAMEDDTMRAAAPASMLEQLWGQLVAQYGAFERFGDVETQEQAPYTRATVPAVFANATVPLLVTVAEDGRVAGLHMGEPVASASPAAYVQPEAFREADVTVGSAPWELPGTLAMPTGDGLFPAVVLLAGSGPQDRDETIGVNAPLRDLAQGLASAGIATLRYDKRTKEHAAEMAAEAATITVREETIDDAIAAVELLRATPGVDPGRIFIAGHSLGAYLAPRIAATMDDPPAGIALLAANSSPLEELILDQFEYLASLGGDYLGPDPEEQLAAIREQVDLVASPELSPTTPATDLPLGVPAAYWLDLRTYDPLATARDLAIPMFLAQGGRDYQVPPSELAAWREVLAGRDDATFREYAALNHLLMAGSGPSTPAEYSEPGHVAEEIVADLAAWILGR